MFKKKVFAKHLDNLLFILITFLRIPRTLVSLNIAELEYTVTVLLQTPRTDSLFCFPKLKILSWNNELILFMREKPSWNTNYQWTTTWTTHEITADMHVVWCYVKHRCLPKLTNTYPQHCFPKLKILSWNNVLILCMREKPLWNTNYQWSTTMHHPWNHSRYTVHVVLCYVLHRRVCQLFGQCMTTQVTHKHSATCCIISYHYSWPSLNEKLAAEER